MEESKQEEEEKQKEKIALLKEEIAAMADKEGSVLGDLQEFLSTTEGKSKAAVSVGLATLVVTNSEQLFDAAVALLFVKVCAVLEVMYVPTTSGHVWAYAMSAWCGGVCGCGGEGAVAFARSNGMLACTLADHCLPFWAGVAGHKEVAACSFGLHIA